LKVEFRESFLKDLKRIRDKKLRGRIREVIELVEQAPTLEEAGDVQKLRSSGAYHRIRVGDYRLGLLQQGDTVIFVRALHRKDEYRYFP
jgi:mRNA interferase RelE/StbE